MKNIFITISCLCSILLYACVKDKELTDPAPIEPDYILPQGNASEAANNRIQALYDNYGSYFLYVYTQKDFQWNQSSGAGNPSTDSVVLGDPAYVEDMLDFLDDVWLQFLPDDFKKGQGLPYRVMMADTIKQRRSGTGWPPGMEYLYYDYKIVGKGITIAGMNASLRTMTGEEKLAKKNILLAAIWNYYFANGIIDIPAEFYTLSNYVTEPARPVNAANQANLEAFRNRGFLPRSYLPNGNPSEWYNNAYSWTSAKTNDAGSFLLHVTQRTDAEMETYLTYPLIKEKFDILVSHFKTKYGIDVRAIANATY